MARNRLVDIGIWLDALRQCADVALAIDTPAQHSKSINGVIMLLFLYLPTLLSGLCVTLLWTPPTWRQAFRPLQHFFWQYHGWLLMAVLIGYVVCACCLYRHQRRHTS